MNTIFFKRASSLISFAVLGIAVSGLSAQAETIDSAVEAMSSSAQTSEVAVTPAQESVTVTAPEAAVDSSITVEPVVATPSTPEAAVDSSIAFEPVVATPSTPTAAAEQSESTEVASTEAATDSTAANSAALLAPAQSSADAPATGTVAQFDPDITPDVTPGQATVSSPSYVGLGAGFDFDGGDVNLAVLSKIGLTSRLSVRPNAVTDFEAAILRLPLTLDFPTLAGVGGFGIAPYLGAGVSFGVGDESDVGPMITGGVDVPLTPRFTGTAAINVDFLDDTEVGAYVGIGLNLPSGLFR